MYHRRCPQGEEEAPTASLNGLKRMPTPTLHRFDLDHVVPQPVNMPQVPMEVLQGGELFVVLLPVVEVAAFRAHMKKKRKVTSVVNTRMVRLN